MSLGKRDVTATSSRKLRDGVEYWFGSVAVHLRSDLSSRHDVQEPIPNKSSIYLKKARFLTVRGMVLTSHLITRYYLDDTWPENWLFRQISSFIIFSVDVEECCDTPEDELSCTSLPRWHEHVISYPLGGYWHSLARTPDATISNVSTLACTATTTISSLQLSFNLAQRLPWMHRRGLAPVSMIRHFPRRCTPCAAHGRLRQLPSHVLLGSSPTRTSS